MYNLTLAILFLVVFSSSSLFSYSQNNSSLLKKSIAVTDFRDATTGQQNAQSGGDANAQVTTNHSDYSTILTTMLTTELIKTNLFAVIEELAPGQGVQMLVSGVITKWEAPPKENSEKIIHSRDISTVTVELRISDGSTGQSVYAQTATSTRTPKNKSIFKSKTEHTLDSAIHDVVVQCIDYIKKAADKVAWEGSVIETRADGIIYIKPGSEGGVLKGMVFDVFQKDKEIKDENGQSLGFDLKKIGSITVSGDINTGKAAKATLTSGKGIKKGDILKLQ